MQRVLLKLSGEALAGDKKTGFDDETIREVALQVKQLVDGGIQVGIVIGGGNFWRNDHELYLCVGNFPFRWNDDQCPDTF